MKKAAAGGKANNRGLKQTRITECIGREETGNGKRKVRSPEEAANKKR